MEGFENFIGLNPWTALFTLINLVITFLILRKFLFGPVKKMIDSRRQEIDDMYAEAETARSEANVFKADCEKQLQEARATAGELTRTAAANAAARGEQILEQANREAAAMRQKAEREIAQDRIKAINEVKGDVSRIALDIAEKVVEKNLDEQTQQSLIEDFLRDMEALV